MAETGRDPLTLQAIFQSAWESYRLRHSAALGPRVRKAAWALMTCRTRLLGGHTKTCPEGHVVGVWYNSCLHRACPQCGFQKLREWVDAKMALLLPCPHFHLTFSLPDKLNTLWAYNRKLFGNTFFTVVAQSLRACCRQHRFLEGEPGFLLAMHTWSRALGVHLHIHCLVTGGGLAPNGTWKPARLRDYLLPTEAIRAEFGRRMVAALRNLLLADQLRLPPGLTRDQALALLDRLAKENRWIVDRRERYDHGRGVANYVTRYLHGGPLRNRRLLAFDHDRVTFRISRKGEKLQTLTLHAHELLHRVLEHVPIPGFRMLRGYGLYAHTAADPLARARAALPEPTEPPAEDASHPDTHRHKRLLGDFCHVCGCQLRTTRFGPDLRGPPTYLPATA